jgi:hypothetical protein
MKLRVELFMVSAHMKKIRNARVARRAVSGWSEVKSILEDESIDDVDLSFRPHHCELRGNFNEQPIG